MHILYSLSLNNWQGTSIENWLKHSEKTGPSGFKTEISLQRIILNP
jgi:hypothetical protein